MVKAIHVLASSDYGIKMVYERKNGHARRHVHDEFIAI